MKYDAVWSKGGTNVVGESASFLLKICLEVEQTEVSNL
jgi:hypothetical protein